MADEKTIFWLYGPKDTTTCRARQEVELTCALARESLDASIEALALSFSREDRELIDDTIMLFDETFAFFQQRADREAQRVIDDLAVSITNRVRVYLRAHETRRKQVRLSLVP
jgi:hypothetical protein